MKSLRYLLFGSTLAFGLFLGTEANAETLYTVKAGDTLSGISHQFADSNALIDSIAKDNKIQDINLIHVGQQLVINDDKKKVEATTAPAVQEETYIEEPIPAEEFQAEAIETPAVASNAGSNYAGQSSSAKEWIAQRESGGSYTASNGYHVGRYQLDPNYLGGDHSPENQERVADQYVADRYGSWENAQAFWMNNGWY